MGKKDKIKNLSVEELAGILGGIGEPRFRAKQVTEWLYRKHAASFEEMSSLPKTARDRLAGRFAVDSLRPGGVLEAKDGARKYSFILDGGDRIESVLIPDGGRLTLCVSSQAGCELGCRYCLTGSRGFRRNLEPAEILDQIIAVRRSLGPDRKLSNLVFMGMGEPFRNFDNLVKALGVITSDAGMGINPRRITVSTVGIADHFAEFGRLGLAMLAVSLNATEDKTRERIMPVNRRYPIRKIIDECHRYPLGKRDRITFEYVLLRGINDTDADSARLAGLLAGIPCKINLIPFNVFPGAEYEAPDPETVERFRERLLRRGYDALVRRSRGAEISAACGSLGGEPVAETQT